MDFNQHGFDVRCEWGSVGLAHLLGDSDAVVIVDVLSFSTCVDIAVSNGALVYPYHVRDESAVTYAKSMNAVLALPRTIRSDVFSLSPTSLQTIPSGTRLVLPSPNGSTLSLATRSIPTIAGCLRNAQVVASAVNSLG
jgi:2-phosphosulfolactate phosphatase